ncbi:Sulfotransferase [Balamuthia mandrillaris]
MSQCEEAALKRAPEKTYLNHHFESKRWEHVKARKSDIVVATAYKAGTTWTQAIVCNLLFQDESKFPAPVMQLSPWVDMRFPPLESITQGLAGQTFRRFMKTHLPATALPLYEDVKYLVVCRDPRDVFFSLYNHWGQLNDELIDVLNKGAEEQGSEAPPLPHPPTEPINEAFREWLQKGCFPWESDGYPFWSNFYHAETWWQLRDWPNVMFIHYNDLKKDLAGQMRRIADFCEIEVSEEVMPKLVSNVTFENMQANASIYLGEDFPQFFKGGYGAFIYKGTNGRWQGVLTEEDLKLYDQVKAKYPADLIAWLEQAPSSDSQEKGKENVV